MAADSRGPTNGAGYRRGGVDPGGHGGPGATAEEPRG